MDIIIIVVIIVIIIILYNNCVDKEDFHNMYNHSQNNIYIRPSIPQQQQQQQQQQVLVPIYSPYRMYYPINSVYPPNYFYPNMFAPYYSQYNILNPNNFYN